VALIIDFSIAPDAPFFSDVVLQYSTTHSTLSESSTAQQPSIWIEPSEHSYAGSVRTRLTPPTGQQPQQDVDSTASTRHAGWHLTTSSHSTGLAEGSDPTKVCKTAAAAHAAACGLSCVCNLLYGNIEQAHSTCCSIHALVQGKDSRKHMLLLLLFGLLPVHNRQSVVCQVCSFTDTCHIITHFERSTSCERHAVLCCAVPCCGCLSYAGPVDAVLFSPGRRQLQAYSHGALSQQQQQQ
jgi:hypothetical protein